jgi:probable phosphoglycerate mutase
LETAGHIGEALGIEAITDPRLREHTNGECADKTIEEARELWPDTWAVPVPLDVRAYPGAETPREFYDRAGAFIDDFASDSRDAVPIVVTHGGTMICLVARWLELSADVLEPIGFDAYTTGITVLRADKHGRRMERLNDTAHLAGIEGGVRLGELFR